MSIPSTHTPTYRRAHIHSLVHTRTHTHSEPRRRAVPAMTWPPNCKTCSGPSRMPFHFYPIIINCARWQVELNCMLPCQLSSGSLISALYHPNSSSLLVTVDGLPPFHSSTFSSWGPFLQCNHCPGLYLSHFFPSLLEIHLFLYLFQFVLR